MLFLQAGILIIVVVIIEFSCFVWAMVVWDNIEIDIKTTMTSYFMLTGENKETNSDSVRWDRLHVKVQLFIALFYLTLKHFITY